MPLSGTLRSMVISAREEYRNRIPTNLIHRLPPAPDRLIDLNCVETCGRTADSPGAVALYSAATRPQPHRQPLAGYPKRWTAFESQTVHKHHQLFVMRLDEASVSGMFPAVVSHDGRLYVEISRVHGEPIETHPIYSRSRLPAPTRLAGRTLLLASAYAGSFYHWMIDTVPRLRLLERARIPLESFEHVILPAEGGRFIDESLACFPRLRASRHIVNNATHFQCEQLFCPSLPHPVGQADSWGPAFLRRTMLGPRRRPLGDERLLLSRATAPRRRVLNEDQIWREVLKPAGFARLCLDDLPLGDQVDLVSRAATIVAPHGAALTHMLFAPRGCSIIELLSPHYPAACFWNLADALGNPYRYIVGQIVGSQALSQARDFEIDPEQVWQCLLDVGAPSITGAPLA